MAIILNTAGHNAGSRYKHNFAIKFTHLYAAV